MFFDVALRSLSRSDPIEAQRSNDIERSSEDDLARREQEKTKDDCWQ